MTITTDTIARLKIGYADPPYIGCAHLYADHPDYAGEVDHAALIDRLQHEFAGWVLHAAATPRSMAVLAWIAWRRPVAQIETDEIHGM